MSRRAVQRDLMLDRNQRDSLSTVRVQMPARTKRRAKFDFHGRPFVWWVDGDRWLRIASRDKRFVVAFPLVRAVDQPPSLTVYGHEFPGLAPSEARPIHLVSPQPKGDSMGAWVEQLLVWCFDEAHEIVTAEGPPRFI